MNKLIRVLRKHSVQICGLGAFVIVLLLCLSEVVLPTYSQSTERSDQARATSGENEDSLVRILQQRNLRDVQPDKAISAIEALKRLAELRGIESTATIEAIASYIDLQRVREKSREELQGIILKPHLRLPDSEFPAVAALEIIGKRALPVLASTIENSERNSAKSSNALYVIKYIFRENRQDAVEFLKSSASSAGSPVQRQRLSDAADSVSREILKEND